MPAPETTLPPPLLLLLLLVHVCAVLCVAPYEPPDLPHDNTTYEPGEDITQPPSAKQIRWAGAAFDYIHSLQCSEVFFTTERECRLLVEVAREDMNVYLADPTPFGKLQAVLPDGGLSRTGLHDAVPQTKFNQPSPRRK